MRADIHIFWKLVIFEAKHSLVLFTLAGFIVQKISSYAPREIYIYFKKLQLWTRPAFVPQSLPSKSSKKALLQNQILPPIQTAQSETFSSNTLPFLGKLYSRCFFVKYYRFQHFIRKGEQRQVPFEAKFHKFSFDWACWNLLQEYDIISFIEKKTPNIFKNEIESYHFAPFLSCF